MANPLNAMKFGVDGMALRFLLQPVEDCYVAALDSG
jgi:hypothetical protein